MRAFVHHALALLAITFLAQGMLAHSVHASDYTDAFRKKCISLDRIEEHYKQSPNVFAASLMEIRDGTPIFDVRRSWKGDVPGVVIITGLSELTFPLDSKDIGRLYIFFTAKDSDRFSKRIPLPSFKASTCRPPEAIDHLTYREPPRTDVLLKSLDDYAKTQ